MLPYMVLNGVGCNTEWVWFLFRGVIGATFYAEVTLDENIKSFLNEGQNVVDRIDSVTDLVN